MQLNKAQANRAMSDMQYATQQHSMLLASIQTLTNTLQHSTPSSPLRETVEKALNHLALTFLPQEPKNKIDDFTG